LPNLIWELIRSLPNLNFEKCKLLGGQKGFTFPKGEIFSKTLSGPSDAVRFRRNETVFGKPGLFTILAEYS